MGKNVYASVKSYSLRGKLLAKADLRTLAESRDLEELITRIKNTVYADAVSGLTKPYSSQAVENALRGHLADIQYLVARTAGDSAILDAYYMRHITTNLKLILKGKVLGKGQEEIEPHLNLRAEELIRQRDVVVKALVSKDLEEAVAGLNSVRMGEEIGKAVALYNERKELQIFDIYFDKILYGHLGRALAKSRGDRGVAGLVGMDIDFYNIQSTLRGRFWGLDEGQIQDLVVSATPAAPREMLSRMAGAASVRDAFGELGATRYREIVPRADSELDALAEFERAFEMTMYRAANRAFSNMFSFATIIGITKLNAYEVRNLAAIAFAVEQKIPAETTMSKLIVGEEEE